MRKNIIKALSQLASVNRIFCSEADFQFALAWELKRIIPSALVILEPGVKVAIKSNTSVQDTFYVDIVVVLNGKRYYIELKYHTSKCDWQYNGFPILLKEHGAQDLLRYDYLKDIDRLLTISKSKTTKNDFGGGFAVVLTNDRALYQQPKNLSTTVLDYFFRIHDRRGLSTSVFPIPGGIVNWNNAMKPSTHWTKKSLRSASIHLPSMINTSWDSYLNFTDNKGSKQDFRFLINEI